MPPGGHMPRHGNPNKPGHHMENMGEYGHQDQGWAEMQGEVDYTEKLVFSDDEENNKSPSALMDKRYHSIFRLQAYAGYSQLHTFCCFIFFYVTILT